MGRRRRRVVKIVRRRLPELYLCPQCGKNTVKATVSKEREQAIVICSNCSLAATYPSDQNMMEVDAYCLFVDNFYNRSVREESVVEP